MKPMLARFGRRKARPLSVPANIYILGLTMLGVVVMAQDELCLDGEEWRKVIGFEGYEVSNRGRVRSVDRFVANGRGVRTCSGKLLKAQRSKQGYMEVNLYENGESHRKQVRRLVAEAFIPCPDSSYEVDHINLVRDDNRVENLRWLSHQDNVARVYHNPSENTKTNLSRASSREFQDAGHMARSVKVVRSDGEVYESVASAARALGYTAGTYVSNHLRGKVLHCKGYTFKYLEDDRPVHSRTPKEVAQIDCDTGDVVCVFPSAGAACLAMSTTGIPNCLSGRVDTCCGYRWEYVDSLDEIAAQ